MPEGEKSKEPIDEETRARLIEAVKFSFDNLGQFLNSDKGTAFIEEELKMGDLEALRRLSYETQVLKNEYGTFSWKGYEEEIHSPYPLVKDRNLNRAMFRSHIFLDLHNHPTSVFTNDLSFPSPVDMTQSRTHDIIVVGANGLSVTGPILRDPSRKDPRFLNNPELMFGTFLRGEPSYYSNKHYDGGEWSKFLVAAGAQSMFYPWGDTSGIERNVLGRTSQDAGYLAWIDSTDPYQRSIALSIFSGMYYDRDFVANPDLWQVLEKFLSDSDPFVRERAEEHLKQIKANIEYRLKNPGQ